MRLDPFTKGAIDGAMTALFFGKSNPARPSEYNGTMYVRGYRQGYKAMSIMRYGIWGYIVVLVLSHLSH